MYDLECSAREKKPCLILVTKHFESIQKSGLAVTDLLLSYFEIDLVTKLYQSSLSWRNHGTKAYRG